tara:strand:+ start:2955 stop:3509 length:555 start_codon:yes stop_codon:yes gene_type:complete
MKKTIKVFILIALILSPLYAISIELAGFQAGSLASQISNSTQNDAGSNRRISVSNFGFLGFDVVNTNILQTFFEAENIDPEIEVSAGAEGLIGSFLIAPSPVKPLIQSYFCYRLGNDKETSINIYTRRGRFVAEYIYQPGDIPGGAAGYNKVPIEIVNELPTGLYFAFLKIDGNLHRTKFEIQK